MRWRLTSEGLVLTEGDVDVTIDRAVLDDPDLLRSYGMAHTVSLLLGCSEADVMAAVVEARKESEGCHPSRTD